MRWFNCLAMGMAIVLLFCPLFITARMAGLVENGFKDVLVSISSDIEAGNKAAMDNIVNTIQSLISNASIELYNATGNRAYFSSVNVTVPSTWTDWSPNRATTDDKSHVVAIDQTRFQRADIRVASPNAAYGDLPYVQQSKGCGEPGDFIHITMDFIFRPTVTKYGSPARLLAREWIKFYFGVFDEQGYDYDEKHPLKYHMPNGQIADTMCSNSKINYKSLTCSSSSGVAGLPNSCAAEVDPNDGLNNNVSSSLMSLPIVPLTGKVCTSLNHNSDAPNKHNIMCDGKSVMDVILSNSKFQDGKNSPMAMSKPPATQFQVTQVSPDIRISLYVVWDNLDQDRNFYSAGPALSKFIQKDIPLGSYFGMTTTEDTAKTLVFRNISSDKDRNDIVEAIRPQKGTVTGGDTVKAVQTAVTNLATLSPEEYINAILIVTSITDLNKWTQICSLVNDRNIQIHLITYSSDTISSYINGKCEGSQTIIKPMVQPPTSLPPEIIDCYNQLQERTQLDQILRKLPSIISPSLYSPPIVYKDQFYSNSTNGTFTVDSFEKTAIESSIYVETCMNLQTPYSDYYKLIKCTVGGTECQSVHDDPTNTICIELSLTKSIYWDFQCKEGFEDKAVPFVVNVVGNATGVTPVDTLDQPIQLFAWTTYDLQPGKDYTRVRIFASLKKGTTPVFNADVVAIITGDSNKNFSVITLRDDGSGNPDATAEDGVYSAYFTQFGTSTGYTVNVKASDNSGQAKVPTKPYPWLSHTNDMMLVSAGSFSRESPAGSFVGKVSIGTDVIEPGRILDLRVQSSVGGQVTLAWTAPGNDLDYGTAKKYVIKCSTNKNEVTNANFGNNYDQASDIPTVTPAIASTKQTVTITGNIDGMTHYCSIKTFDERLSSASSNIVSYYLLEEAGLSAAQTAGISLGIIFGIIFAVVIILLIWYCCFRKNKKDKGPQKPNGEELRPISQVTSTKPEYKLVSQVDIDGDKDRVTFRPSYMNENETNKLQQSRPKSNSNSSLDSKHSNGKSSTAPTATVQGSRTPSPKPIIPIMFPQGMYGQQRYDNVPSDDDDDDDVITESADVARPQVLTKIATIENTKRFHESPKIPPKPAQPDTAPSYNRLLPGAYNTSFAPSSPGYSKNAQV